MPITKDYMDQHICDTGDVLNKDFCLYNVAGESFNSPCTMAIITERLYIHVKQGY